MVPNLNLDFDHTVHNHRHPLFYRHRHRHRHRQVCQRCVPDSNDCRPLTHHLEDSSAKTLSFFRPHQY